MIYITGDTHIPVDIKKLNSKKFPEQRELSENDYVIICGDFGGVWENSPSDLYWLKWLNTRKFTTLFVDGNHENFELLNTYELVDFCGGKAHKIADKIYHLMRGEIFQINGKSFFAFGGAESHDKEYRTSGKTWWTDEMPSADEYKNAISNLNRYKWEVDYVITHCCATSIQQEVASNLKTNELTDFFEKIKSKLTYDKWFCGHYHVDKTIANKQHILYNEIIKLSE